MCISEKRGRHSQSYVEVILPIENVPKMYQKCFQDGRLQAKDRGKPPYPFLLFPSTPNVGGLRTLRGSRKSVYNLFMGSFGPILVPTWRNLDPTWIQLRPNLDPTWHQLQPTCEN